MAARQKSDTATTTVYESLGGNILSGWRVVVGRVCVVNLYGVSSVVRCVADFGVTLVVVILVVVILGVVIVFANALVTIAVGISFAAAHARETASQRTAETSRRDSTNP